MSRTPGTPSGMNVRSFQRRCATRIARGRSQSIGLTSFMVRAIPPIHQNVTGDFLRRRVREPLRKAFVESPEHQNPLSVEYRQIALGGFALREKFDGPGNQFLRERAI